MSSRTTPNFCSQCGASLSPGDAFCSQCGTAVGDATTGGSRSAVGGGSPRDSGPVGGRTGGADGTPTGGGPHRSAFRKRVEDRQVEGWSVTQDYGDRVVMTDRDFGSLGVHLALLFLTGSVGNVIYGWYCYGPAADRIVLRADGTERPLDAAGTGTGTEPADGVTGRISDALPAVLLAAVGLAFVSNGSLVGVAVGVGLLAVALGLVPPVRERLEERKPVTTFGSVRETEESVVRDADVPCVACARPVGQGVERTYRERTYVAGVPLATTDGGTNRYCRSCAQGDPFAASAPERERVRER